MLYDSANKYQKNGFGYLEDKHILRFIKEWGSEGTGAGGGDLSPQLARG